MKKLSIISILVLSILCIQNAKVEAFSNTDSLTKLLGQNYLDDEEEAQILYEIGESYIQKGALTTSISYFKKALSIYNRIGNLKMNAKINYRLGGIYSQFNSFEKSLEFYLKAKATYEDIGNDSMYYDIKAAIGKIHFNLSNYKQALDYFYVAKVYYEQTEYPPKKILKEIYSSIGVAHGYIENSDSSLHYFNKALLMTDNSDLVTKAGVLNNIGAIYSKLLDHEKALSYYSDAMQLFERAENKRGAGVALYNIAIIQYRKGESKKSKKMFEEALEYFKETSSLFYMIGCYQYLSDIAEENNDLKKALEYFRLCVEAEDSLQNYKTINRIAELETQYEVSKLEKIHDIEIKLLEHEKKLSVFKWYVAFGILIITIGIFLTIIYRFKTKRKLTLLKLENSKNEKEHILKEMENLAFHISHKNNLMNSLKGDLKELSKDANPSGKEKIKDLNIKLTKSLQLNKGFESIQSKMEELNVNFFFQLSQRHPKLTENDKKLCALLKLNLSSKEIAEINNISERSVVTARSRLRKKLGLQTEENLTDYLTKLS